MRKSNPTNEGNRASKFTPAYWRPRLFQPTYGSGDGLRNVEEFYCQIQSAGRREKIALGTNNREEASRTAARLFKTIAAKGWKVALAEVLPGKVERKAASGCPTIGEFLAAILSHCVKGNAEPIGKYKPHLDPKTFNNYAVCLRWISARALGVKASASRFGKGNKAWREHVEKHRLDELTPDLVEETLLQHSNAFLGNPVAERKAKNSAASFARQARSLFAAEVLKHLPFTTIPNPFAGLKVESARIARYVSQMDAATLLRLGRDELKADAPEAYKALLLALGAGLRRREIDNLQWQQVDSTRCVVRVMANESFSGKTVDSENEVFVDAGLIAELDQFRAAAGSLYVLEESRKVNALAVRSEYRAAEPFAVLVAWLRKQGVTSHKPIHALRKEFGSIVTASSDIHVAMNQLRHSDISTTAKYYTDARRRVAPQIGSMLKDNSAETKTS